MNPVFLDYDQERLDALLDARRMTPDWQTYADRFEARSAQVRAQFGAHLDVRYGPHERERLDVFLPTDASGPLPVNVFFHGGYWRSADKERYSFIADTFLSAGAAYVAVEYALIPSVDMDELVRQCRAAVAYLHANAVDLGIDADRIFASGHSAGGQIVGMLAAAGWHDSFGVPLDVVKGVCGISGLYDLEAIRRSYLNATLALTPESSQRNSPATLRPAVTIPFIAAVGGDEGAEFARQNALIEQRWGAELPVTTITLPDANHYQAVEALGTPASGLARATLAQMMH